MRRFFTRRRILVTIAIVALLFVAFEIGVRLLPPDAVSYRIDEHNLTATGIVVTTISGTVTAPKTVARWRTALTDQPPAQSLFGIYLSNWEGTDTCSRGGYDIATYRFTWHGLPVAVVSTAPSCAGRMQISSGGIPDWNTYLIDPLPQP